MNDRDALAAVDAARAFEQLAEVFARGVVPIEAVWASFEGLNRQFWPAEPRWYAWFYRGLIFDIGPGIFDQVPWERARWWVMGWRCRR